MVSWLRAGTLPAAQFASWADRERLLRPRNGYWIKRSRASGIGPDRVKTQKEYASGGSSLSVRRASDKVGLPILFQKAGLDPVGGTPEDLAKYQTAEIAKWNNVVKTIGYVPE